MEVWDFPFDEAGLELNEAYRTARRTAGLIRVLLPYGEPAWLATRYEDVRFVLGDPRFSRALAVTEACPRVSAGVPRGGLLFMDRPDHSRLRRLVAKAFTVRRVEVLRPKVSGLAAERLAAMQREGAPADLVESYAKPIRTSLICDLLGVPPEDRPGFRSFCEGVVSTGPASAAEFAANYAGLTGYMSQLVGRRRSEPADDLMTDLIAARDARDQLSDAELVDVCIDILLPGYQSQVPNFVYALTRQDGCWQQLLERPQLLLPAIEELVRFVPLVEGAPFPRYSTEDVTVGGTLVRAGEPVLVSMASANRDDAEMADPDRLVLDRARNRHLGFGHGVHHCLGAQLAKMALQEELGALLRELPGLRVGEDVTWSEHTGIRSLLRLPVSW